MEAVVGGGNRQALHETIREVSMKAWQQISVGKPNPLVNLLKNDKIITKYVDKNTIEDLINPAAHIGLAQGNCEKLLSEIEKEIKNG